MTNKGMASHTHRSKLIDGDPVAIDANELREAILRQDERFCARLEEMLARGLEHMPPEPKSRSRKI
jgi:hypothetical protein